ncbi:trigger factor [Fulvivirga sp. RKSG066]|uniref:trigger factor n=1 Tax=Fulvivirga aurantia TaxID=2529383 RepID=UPI0012BBC808|nr:trigger factor [Fulvivirga aurantia]MTI21297.1 trigger factor [Fulvivirga aurantia]
MDITLDKKSSTEASIKVTLKESDYQPNVEEKVKEYAKKANIKGFRPGKVPTGLIKKMYGKSIIVEEVNSILSKSLQEYIKENNIQLIGEPLPDMEKASQIDWENQKDFEFDYNIGLVDEFDYDLSNKQKVKSYKIELDKKALDETLENVKKQFGESTNPEVSEEGDAFYGELKQVEGELSKEGVIQWDDLDKKEHKKFTGVKPGDIVELDIQKAFKDHATIAHLLDVGHEKAKELTGKFTFIINKINRIEPAELNQDLFDKVFGKDSIKSEEEFVEKVKNTVEENYNRETDHLLDRDIKDHFVKNTKIEIPVEFLKTWLLQSNEGKVTAEDIEKEIDEYVKQLKWDLIKNKIAEKSEIKVENEEVVDKAKNMILQQLGGQGMAEQMKDHLDSFADNYLKGENGQNYMKVFGEVRDEKILNHIKDEITITEKKVTLDEFQKIVSN